MGWVFCPTFYSFAGGATSANTESPTGLTTGTGVRVVATEKSFTQGSALQTGNALDVLIQGRGFFQVLQPDGTLAYSRDGSFKVDSEGRLVTASGFSQTTCLPASAAAIVGSAWSAFGPRLSRSPIAGSATSSCQSVVHRSKP